MAEKMLPLTEKVLAQSLTRYFDSEFRVHVELSVADMAWLVRAHHPGSGYNLTQMLDESAAAVPELLDRMFLQLQNMMFHELAMRGVAPPYNAPERLGLAGEVLALFHLVGCQVIMRQRPHSAEMSYWIYKRDRWAREIEPDMLKRPLDDWQVILGTLLEQDSQKQGANDAQR